METEVGKPKSLLRFGCFPMIVSSFLSFALLSFSLPAYAEEAESENVCISCHLEMEDVLKQVVDDWKLSVHAEGGVECQDCHGGDPTDFGEAMEPAKGFVGKPEIKDIPKFCSKCHSDPLKMRPYNLPYDQFEKYSDSVHGEKLAAGNENVPTCMNCHGGTHAIKRVADPESAVNRKNIVRTCASCHSNASQMADSKLPINQYDLYKVSTHGMRYFEGDMGVPSCTDCHSNHRIRKPQEMSVKLVCMNCHISQEETYKMSLHWDAAQQNGVPTCIDCHSNHDVMKPTIAKFVDEGKGNCVTCHAKNSLQMETGTALHKLLKDTEDNLNKGNDAVKRINEWSGSGFETSHLTNKMKKVNSMLKEMVVASHSMDVDPLNEKANSAENLTKEVMEEVDARTHELSRRKYGLVASWLVFLAFSWSLVKRSRHCKRD